MAAKTEDQSLTIPSLENWPKMSNGGGTGGPYIVIVYNDDYHTFDEVILQMQKAIGCTYEHGLAIAVEIDRDGRCVVFAGTQDECEHVAAVLREIRLQVETDKAI
ncbi:MAG TPA: ATP-dependent Clp protease adaptor ClpS [Capsulimonadaceae bacterium]|jgi:ATP-dependent Clp protease adapter protein ClpS